MKTLFTEAERKFLRDAQSSTVLFEMDMPPSGFLEGSIYKDPLYVGSKRMIKTGHSLVPEGGHEYGIYLTPNSRYARLYGPHLAEVFVRMKNPIVVEGKHELSPTDLTIEDIKRLKKQGHDGIVVTSSTVERATEVVAFDRKQVWVIRVR